MTIQYYIGGKITGLAADTKPLNVPEFTTFIETDTFTEFILVAGVWEQIGSTPILPTGGWKELERDTLGAPADILTVANLDNKKYYMFLFDKRVNVNATVTWRLNNDSNAIYSTRYNYNNALEQSDVGQVSAHSMDPINGTPSFGMGYIANIPAKEKLVQSWLVNRNTAGEGTAPQRSEFTWSWANTIDAVNRLDMIQTIPPTADYDTGSELVILEWDPDDTHTDNFWEILASADLLGGTASALTTPIFTPKKYMWIQYYMEESVATANVKFRVGNNSIDAGANYAFRRSVNGAADTTLINQDGFFSSVNGNAFASLFAINVSDQEKLFISHGSEISTAGANNLPDRTEVVAKWDNVANQFNIVSCTTTATFGLNSFIKVWGHD